MASGDVEFVEASLSAWLERTSRGDPGGTSPEDEARRFFVPTREDALAASHLAHRLELARRVAAGAEERVAALGRRLDDAAAETRRPVLPDRPSASKPIMAPVISSHTELATQCATVIEPRLKAAIREVAKQRPAEPLRFLADLLTSDSECLPSRNSAQSALSGSESVSQDAASTQSVASYLSAEVLPAVHGALLELIRYQPPVTDDAALAAEIMARALRSGAGFQST